MERPESDAASDDAMESFLEKFQSQPYRGGFHEDRKSTRLNSSH